MRGQRKHAHHEYSVALANPLWLEFCQAWDLSRVCWLDVPNIVFLFGKVHIWTVSIWDPLLSSGIIRFANVPKVRWVYVHKLLYHPSSKDKFSTIGPDKTMDISLQKEPGARQSPKGILVKWKRPWRVQKADCSLALLVSPIAYPDRRSKVAKYFAPRRWSNASWMSGNGYASVYDTAFTRL